MDVENPVPLSASLLLLALPGVWLFGQSLAARALGDRSLGRLIAPALSLSSWLVAVHASALALHSFIKGLWVGTLAVAVAGTAAWLLRAQEPAPPRRAVGAVARSWAMGLLATLIIAPIALRFAFHDELFFTGHMSIASEIQNDIYPPRHLTFPEFELRYHYGFDLLCATVGALLRLRVDHAIDAITLALWLYSWCLLSMLGDRMIRPGWGWLTATMTLFGGGLAPLLLRGATPVERALSFGIVDGAMVNPPLVSYFFQHPWSLGLPFALAAIHLAWGGPQQNRAGSLLAVGILLVALAISQIVLFLSLCGALMADELVRARKAPRHALAPLATVIAGALAASRLHGFFAPGVNVGGLMSLRAGVASGAWATLLWHVATFGFLFPLGIAGVALLDRSRLLYVALLLGSLFAVNAVRYTYSWDIVKFAVVTALALSISGSVAVARLCARSSVWSRAAGISLALGACGAGLSFSAVFALDPIGIPEEHYHRRPQWLQKDATAAVGWLRHQVRAGEIVFCPDDISYGCAQWGGLPQLRLDEMVPRSGFSPESIARREQLLRALPDEPSPYLASGIRWFLAPSSLTPVFQRWAAAGRAEIVKTSGQYIIVRLR